MIAHIEKVGYYRLIDLMMSKDSEIYNKALSIVSGCFAEDDQFIEFAIEHGSIFTNFEALLSDSKTHTLIRSLWGLSNIAASDD